MKVIELTDKNRKAYDQFVASHPLGNIHQSWQWGEFQSKLAGRDKFWVFAVIDENGPAHTSNKSKQSQQHDSGLPLHGQASDAPLLRGQTPSLAGNANSASHSSVIHLSHASTPANSVRQILASALVIRQRLPFNKCWIYCPRGPLADFSGQTAQGAEALELLFQKISELASQENAVFFRFDSTHERSGCVPAHAHHQPENTLILDISEDPEKILQQMKPKGRYNIKVAQKHGVNIRVISAHEQSDLQSFYDLIQQTTSRDGFSGHNKKYYEDMLQTLGPDHAKLYLAEYWPEQKTPAASNHQSQTVVPHAASSSHPTAPPLMPAPTSLLPPVPLAAAIVTYFKDTATYYFGASSNQHRNVMAPYLLHWQAILDARTNGYKYYDFFGISPTRERSECAHNKVDAATAAPNPERSEGQTRADAPSRLFPRPLKPHPWASVTEFKLKFGGKRVDYLPAQEIVYKPFWYAIVRLTKWLKKIKPR